MLAWQQILYAQSDSNRLHVLVYADWYATLMPKGRNVKNLVPNVYSHHRVNELALNLGLVDINWKADKRTQLNLGLMTGTYAQTNLAHEPLVFRFLYEANVVYALLPKQGVDLQVGIFPSHIGMESAIGIQNHTLSRSLQADNSPYYESGLKLSKQFKNDKGSVSVLALNGWQRMTREVGQNIPAIGHQFLYRFNKKLTLNSSSFIGNMAADSLGEMRYFHNLWIQYQMNDQWLCAGGFDLGNQRKGVQQYGGYWWSTLQVYSRYAIHQRVALCARWERVNDWHQFLFSFQDPETRFLNGYSINADYRISDALQWRTEIRCFKEQHTKPQYWGTMSLVCLLEKN